MKIDNLADGTIIFYNKRRYVVTRDQFDLSKKKLVFIDRTMTTVYPSSWKTAKIIFNPKESKKDSE